MITSRRYRRLLSAALVSSVSASLMIGCAADTGTGPESEPDEHAAAGLTFDEFEARTYREPGTGVYIVDGDTPIDTREGLLRFYDDHVRSGALAIRVVNGSDDKWNDTWKRLLNYCVSPAFGARHDEVVRAMELAAGAWEKSANVQFAYSANQDALCWAGNNDVVFDVEPTSGQPYLARAFFPSYDRAYRNIMIDDTSFTAGLPANLPGILRHELGHTLGFRHEQTRPEAGACFEDWNWRGITPYDSASVMHYPQCNGTNTWSLRLTARDKSGAASIYGAPAIYGVYAANSKWSDWFAPPGETPAVGDFNGDGVDDLVTFTQNSNADVYVALSSGSSFGAPSRWISGFAYTGQTPRVGDFNGDGMADIAVFTQGTTGDVYVSLSTGTGFSAPTLWNGWFAPAGEVPQVGDFNGDGKADIVTFTQGATGDVYVGLSSGSSFGAAVKWHDWFAPAGEVPRVGDVNGDGKADIITFTQASTGDVYIALSSGSSFGSAAKWNDWFSPAGEVPAVGDFNNDGRSDILTFTQGTTADVYGAMSNGTAFVASVLRDGSFSPAGETPLVGDFNGDGVIDLVSFTRSNGADAMVALGQ